jgi:hypothetical protein
MATPSPGDRDVEMADASMRAATRASTRSKKRPNSSQVDVASARLATANPRTHRARKSTNSASVQERPASVTIKSSPSQHAWGADQHTQQQHHASPNDSVSPEPLDNSMPPPKYPASASATNSPAIVAKSKKGGRQGPATPASLMKMQKSRGAKAAVAEAPPPLSIDPSLPPLALPEAAASPTSPDISPADLSISRKTPKLGPMSTPGSSGVISALTMTAPDSTLHSPLSGGFSNAKKADPKPRNKKRGSIMNGALVSPALRPKISPSIKPLLPEGGE